MGESQAAYKDVTSISPPAYEDSPPIPSSSSNSNSNSGLWVSKKSKTSQIPKVLEAPPPATYAIFPKDIVFYRTTYASLIVGPPYEADKPQPPPLFCVSITMEHMVSNKTVIPQIRLHYGPDDTYPVIGDVRFRLTTTSDITIWHNNFGGLVYNSLEESATETHVELTKQGALTTDVHAFSVKRLMSDGTYVTEKFAWKHSGDPEVRAIATENVNDENYARNDRGQKLMNLTTGDMVAVFKGGEHSRRLNPKRIAGKLRFSGKDEGSEELRLIVVMSILSIMERGRRNAVAYAGLWCEVM